MKGAEKGRERDRSKQFVPEAGEGAARAVGGPGYPQLLEEKGAETDRRTDRQTNGCSPQKPTLQNHKRSRHQKQKPGQEFISLKRSKVKEKVKMARFTT